MGSELEGGRASSAPDAGASDDRDPPADPATRTDSDPDPVADECGDGLDGDGDGVVDEDCYCRSGERASCYRGAPESRGVGACADGVMDCTGTGEFPTWGECAADVTEGIETCDGVTDEDCDGGIDEGCECVGDAPVACGSDEGECRSGVQRCDDGALGACEGAVGPAAETCNGLDDDCDGSVDEAIARSCGSGVGACTAGSSRCVGGAWLACEGETGPTTELCNGTDDDCDAIVDEGTELSCGSDVGTCSPGVSVCAGGSYGACEGSVDPASEVCDGTDEDCDGAVDEDCDCVDGTAQPCGTDVGACAPGTQLCTGGRWQACSGAVAPSAETCNGVDDDCDGAVDEALSRTCGSDLGACVSGVRTCSAGTWGACAGEVVPVTETCNGLDDDCDGSVDDALTTACGTDIGECTSGTRACMGGVWAACAGSVGPVAEDCSGGDDDCDGMVDEGCTCFDGTVVACGTDVGRCESGTQRCTGGAFGACSGGTAPSADICNTYDDDCDGAIDEGACLTYTVVIEPGRELDLLFVIDDSGSMMEEQASLTARYPSLLAALETSPGGLPSLHVGVTSSNVSIGRTDVWGCTAPDDGRLQNTPGYSCTPPSGYYIEDVIQADGTRRRNYTGALGDAFACIATLGTTGCGFEQHFEAMKRALDGSQPTNAGFLRPDAFLAVVFLADEDDCSASDLGLFDPASTSVGPFSSYRCTEYGVQCDGSTLPRTPGSYATCEPRAGSPYVYHPDRYVSFLNGLKADPSRLISAAIVGQPTPFSSSTSAAGNTELDPSCTSASGLAYPAVRFRHFLDAFPGRSAFTSICDADLSGALTVIGDTIATAMSSACLPNRPLDLDPTTAELDADCVVEDVEGYGTPTERVVATIPECTPTSSSACHELVESAPGCPSAPSIELRIHRNGTPAPAGTRPLVRCRWPG